MPQQTVNGDPFNQWRTRAGAGFVYFVCFVVSNCIVPANPTKVATKVPTKVLTQAGYGRLPGFGFRKSYWARPSDLDACNIQGAKSASAFTGT